MAETGRTTGRFAVSVLSAAFVAAFLLSTPCRAAEQDPEPLAKLSLDREACYVREEIELTFEIEWEYETKALRYSIHNLNVPETFLEEFLPFETQPNRTVITRRLVPLTPGTFRIGPAEIYYKLIKLGDVPSRVARKGPTPVSNVVKVRVLPLPKDSRGRVPACMVGEVSGFSVNPDKTSVELGEAIVLSFEISGRGSMRTFRPPGIRSSASFSAGELVERKIMLDEETGIKRMTYRQEIIPIRADAREIPPIGFTYFDTADKKYVTLKQGPFPLVLDLSRASGKSEDVEEAGEGPEFADQESAGMRGIKRTLGGVRSENVETLFTRAFWFIQAVPLAAILLSGIYVLYRRRVDAEELHNFARAHPRARREIKRARKLLKSGDVEGCFNMLPKIIAGYVGDKLNVPRAGMTNQEVVRHVYHHTSRRRFRRQVDALFKVINRTRYTAESLEPRKVRKWLKSTERITNWMERHRIFRHVKKEYRKRLGEEAV